MDAWRQGKNIEEFEFKARKKKRAKGEGKYGEKSWNLRTEERETIADSGKGRSRAAFVRTATDNETI